MLSSIEPFASTEIAYRRSRIAADFGRANASRPSRRPGRPSRPSRPVPRPAYRPAGARG